eukprot:Gb_21114 [translate_table: standard]
MALEALFAVVVLMGFLANTMNGQIIYASPPPPSVICTACATCENPCTPVAASPPPPPPPAPVPPKNECPPPPPSGCGNGCDSPQPPASPTSFYPYYPYYTLSLSSPLLCNHGSNLLLLLIVLPFFHFILNISV